MCDIYIDDVVIEEYVNTPTVYLHEGETVTKITEGVDFGSTYALSVPANVPEGKYFAGWVDAAGNELTKLTLPDASVLCEAHAYAVYKDYVTDGYAVNYEGITTKPATKGIAYMQDGAYKTSVTESSWGASYWDGNYQGIVMGRNSTGSATGWDPVKLNTDAQLGSSHKGYVAVASEGVIGEEVNVGWGNNSNYVLRDREGNAIIPKANTKYAVTINYTTIGAGDVKLTLLGDRKLGYTAMGANATGASTYGASYSSNSLDINNAVPGEKGTYTFFITTKNFSDAVPMFSVHSSNGSLRGVRVAEAPGSDGNMYASYTAANGKTYYPYQVVEIPSIAIQSFSIVEVDEGNVAVQFTSYEKGVGYSSVVGEGKPGSTINVDTKNFDNKWYYDTTGYGTHTVTTYPDSNKFYYDAGYAQAHVRNGDSVQYYFGDGHKNGAAEATITFENTKVDDDYALHVATDVAVGVSDAESFILAGAITDKHTYKVTYKYKATAANSSFGFAFGIHQGDNFWSRTAGYNFGEFRVKNVKTGEWVEETVYFTADVIGTVTDETETGIDYNLKNDSRVTLSAVYVQDATEAGNDLYFKDFEIVDLGEVVTKGGASVLTAEAADAAGSQAMRFYFSYETEDGSTIKLGNDTLKVVERGFLYRNGYLEKDAVETAFRTNTGGIKKVAKTDGFNVCWDYDDATDKMTFSTYVTGFKKADDVRKLEVKAYIIAQDAKGNQFTIYADSINRSVAGVQGLSGATDTDINAGQ